MEATVPTQRCRNRESVGRGTVNRTACDAVFAAILRQVPKVQMKETTPSFRHLKQIWQHEQWKPERPYNSDSD
jgi:hypothetical protein